MVLYKPNSPGTRTHCAGAKAELRLPSGLCIWREIPATWAGLGEKPRSLGRLGAKSPSSCATIGSGRRGGGAETAAAARSTRLEATECACGGPSALSSDGPRGGRGAGRRQPARSGARRGGREVPEALPGLPRGVSRGLPFLAGLPAPPLPTSGARGAQCPARGARASSEPRGRAPRRAAPRPHGASRALCEAPGAGRAGVLGRNHGEPFLQRSRCPVPV